MLNRCSVQTPGPKPERALVEQCGGEELRKRPVRKAGEGLEPKTLAAIEAYQRGERTGSIAARLGISTTGLYYGLKAKGIPIRKKPKRWCAWCGNDLRHDQKLFCTMGCRHDFSEDEKQRKRVAKKDNPNACIGEDQEELPRCAFCDAILNIPRGSGRRYCGPACKKAKREQKWADIAATARRMLGGLDITQIAEELNLSRSTVCNALAKTGITGTANLSVRSAR